MTETSTPNPSSSLSSKLARLLPHDPSLLAKPKVERLEFEVRLSGSPKHWMHELSDVGFTSANLHKDGLDLELVQSLDLNGQPHQLIHLFLAQKRIRLDYTVLPNHNPVRRRLEAARLLLLALSSLDTEWSSPSLSSFTARALQEALDSVSVQSDELQARVRELQDTCRERESRLSSQQREREADAKKMVADAQHIEAMQSRLRLLDSMPDSALDEEVMEWLRSHDGQISVRQVAALHNLPPARIEQSLDRLSKSGHIARKENP